MLGPVPTVAIFWAVTLAAISLFTMETVRLVRLMRAGTAEPRFDQPVKRLVAVVEHVFAHGRLLERPYSGLLHLFIFWGFLILTILTVEHFGHGLFPGFRLPLLDGWPPYLFSQDLFNVLVLVGVAMAVYQRTVIRPPRLSFNADGMVILGLIALLMISNLVASGAETAVDAAQGHPEPGATWKPVSALLAGLFGGLPLAAQEALYRIGWWGHQLIVLAFLVYIPRSKHQHIVAAGPNVYFRSLAPKGDLPSLDIEKALENDEPVG